MVGNFQGRQSSGLWDELMISVQCPVLESENEILTIWSFTIIDWFQRTAGQFLPSLQTIHVCRFFLHSQSVCQLAAIMWNNTSLDIKHNALPTSFLMISNVGHWDWDTDFSTASASVYFITTAGGATHRQMEPPQTSLSSWSCQSHCRERQL